MDYKIIRRFDNYISANILLSRMIGRGFDAHLFDENTVTTMPIWTSVVGGIKLVVPKEQEEDALNYLKEIDAEYLSQLQCPKCGNNEIVLIPKDNTSNKLGALLSWIFSSFAVSAENVYHCRKCGFESSEMETFEPEVKSIIE